MTRTPRPPGPSPAMTLARLASGNVGVTDLLLHVTERYRDIAHVRLGREHVYVLTDAELVRQFFVEHYGKVNKAPALKESNALLGNGLLTSEGDEWRRQRKLVQPGFHNARIQNYASIMGAATRRRTDTWEDRQTVDLGTELSSITLDIVVRTLFGGDLGDRSEKAAVALNDVMDASARWLMPGGKLRQRFPSKGNRVAKKSSQHLVDLVQGLIADHRENGDTGDVLSMLLAATDDETGLPMSDQQVQDEVMTMILAGHETTAMALTWSLLMLHESPDHQKAMQAELARLGPEVGFHDVVDLPLTKAVFAEGLRLYPPAWIMGRKVVDDLTLAGWDIPVGSTVVTSPLALQRSNQYWRNAALFDPTRWLNEAGAFDDEAPGQPAGAWLPFGMGQRKCVGQVFAWTEGVIILATLLRNFEVRTLVHTPVDVTPAITLRPKHGIPATVHAR